MLGACLFLIGLIVMGLWQIGYFGGPVFTDVPATARTPPGKAKLVAVVFSGDAGYQIGMASMIGRRLAADGIPVVGVNTLTYFRTTRTPAAATRLIGAAIDHAIAYAHADHLILIGHSYGADILHVGLADLPEHLRHKVRLVALVVPGETVELRASPGGLLSFAFPDAPALATARLLDWVPVVCIQGIEETNSLCPLLSAPNMVSEAMPGGHSMHWDADGLTARLLAVIARSLPIITKVSGDEHAPVMP